MENKEYTLNSKIQMKKKHPCGGDVWEVIRLGADIKIKCMTCSHTILIPRVDLNKKIKKVITEDVK